MFVRVLLIAMFLANLGLSVWFSIDTKMTSDLQMAANLFEESVDGTGSAELQVKIGRSLAERALRSEAKMNWARYLLVVNAIAFLLSFVFVTLIPKPDGGAKSSDA